MTKVRGPLFGLEAHGRIGNRFYFTKRQHANIAAKITPPADPKTSLQLEQRSWFQECIAAWHSLTVTQKQTYNDLAHAQGQVSGYIVFMREWLVGSVPIHAPTHEDGGTDEIEIAADQVNSGRFGLPRMPAGTLGHVLTGQGVGADPIYTAPGGGGKRTCFAQPHYAAGTGAVLSTICDSYGASRFANGQLNWLNLSMSIPSDFTSLTKAVIIMIPNSTGNLYLSAETMFAKLNENYYIHNTFIDAAAKTVTEYLIYEYDLSTLFANLAANDRIGITFTRDATNPLDTSESSLYVLGALLEYT